MFINDVYLIFLYWVFPIKNNKEGKYIYNQIVNNIAYFIKIVFVSIFFKMVLLYIMI